ncbi:MAG: nucleoside deaminase [Candidatus Promineofilum sp.]|nr:nucleoside deaminase [Promineifilum sp.]
MDETDLKFIRLSFQVAAEARAKGNHPFGALLVDDGGHVLLRGENTVVTDHDCTGHAETNLIREASRAYSPEFLSRCTLYASTEPCPMCAGAIFWSNVRRVVFGLSTNSLNALVGEETPDVLYLPSRELFAKGRKPIEVLGPVLEEEALQVHAGFWG